MKYNRNNNLSQDHPVKNTFLFRNSFKVMTRTVLDRKCPLRFKGFRSNSQKRSQEVKQLSNAFSCARCGYRGRTQTFALCFHLTVYPPAHSPAHSQDIAEEPWIRNLTGPQAD